ncbi:polysaccharide biosynthesis tyrosine autokinase [Knoellia sp. p5-6-4]|uniref:polysaccharide biosynthesis tyrosine autokinase n=1 Tax=unclassified Knoellia TaxID=2618719 RepID=UPI0023DBDD4E|nr:polysaccharide biosynthesis tyrosine autokinase [Knoellia sp. p5-6-4]MDF2144478.1 Wzz/FepE/Etk N-terminal domain-containing protein [Knoellia sp. p5-6-4]
MELTDYLRLVRTYWRAILGITLVAIAAAAVLSAVMPPAYEATARGFVSYGTVSDPSKAEASDTVSKSRAKSYVQLATSRAIAEDVIRRLRLRESPGELVARITAEQPVDTVLVEVTARAATPSGAKTLADTWITALQGKVAAVENPQQFENAETLRLIPVEEADLPTRPVSPRTTLYLSLAALLGLGSGLAYALARRRSDHRLRTTSAISESSSVPVVGGVPSSPALGRSAVEVMALMRTRSDARSSQGLAADSFRRLRTHLQFADGGQPPAIVVVTAPQTLYGTSTVATNLAIAMAAAGQAVVLVDANLRHPTTMATLGLADGDGLAEVLTGEVPVGAVLQRVEQYPSLQVLGAGTSPLLATELVDSAAMHSLLQLLSRDATVLVDAPPLLQLPDAALLSRMASGALLVVSADRTTSDELGATLARLEHVGARALGIVLNHAGADDLNGDWGSGAGRSDRNSGHRRGVSEDGTRVGREPVRPAWHSHHPRRP